MKSLKLILTEKLSFNKQTKILDITAKIDISNKCKIPEDAINEILNFSEDIEIKVHIISNKKRNPGSNVEEFPNIIYLFFRNDYDTANAITFFYDMDHWVYDFNLCNENITIGISDELTNAFAIIKKHMSTKYIPNWKEFVKNRRQLPPKFFIILN